MMYAEFLRFYNYTAEQALSEYAKRFFGLVNSMYRIQAKEALNGISVALVGSGNTQDGGKILDHYKQQYKGQHGILQEVRNIKG